VTTGAGEVFDLGYQGYAGERTGRWARRRAIWRDGVRTSLGLGRGFGAKFTSWLLIGLALVPVLVLVVIAAFVGQPRPGTDDFELPSYADYYHWAIAPLGLFAAVVAPLLICPDRRDRVLSLYAARPISPLDYLGSRWAAFLTVFMTTAWLPPAILFVWNLLDASSPGSFLSDSWDIVPRSLGAAALVAVVLTTLALLASSFATRRAYAAVAILAVIFVGSAIGGISDSFQGSVAKVLTLASLPAALIDSVHWIFGSPLSDRPFAGWVSVLWLVSLALAMCLALVLRAGRLVRG
jgi:ABC-2 type transport system permease protein